MPNGGSNTKLADAPLRIIRIIVNPNSMLFFFCTVSGTPLLQNSKYLKYKVRSAVVTLNHHSNAICLCPLDGIIETISKKWALLLVNELGNHGSLRNKDLFEELKGISPSTLASMLKGLEKEDIISRRFFNEIPPRVEYTLTKRGKELRIAIIPLLKWATKKGNFKMHCNCSLLKK